MNLIIKYCIESLEKIKSSAIDLPQNNPVADGINLVNECIRSGVQDRVQALAELASDVECVRNDKDAVFYCLEEINSFIWVLKEFAAEYKQDDFGKSVKGSVRSYVDKLKPIKEHLDRIEAERKYTN